MPPKSRSKRVATTRRDEPEPEDQGYDTSAADDDVQALHSDNLDDDEAGTTKRKERAGAKRKEVASPMKPKKRRKKARSDGGESDSELKQGQEVVGKIVRAPKTGQGGVPNVPRDTQSQHFFSVPPGQISRNTFDFLNQLKEPACNDREWLVPFLGLDLNPSIEIQFLPVHALRRFKLNGAHVFTFLVSSKFSRRHLQNRCSGRRRRNGRRLSMCAQTTSPRSTHRSHTYPQGT